MCALRSTGSAHTLSVVGLDRWDDVDLDRPPIEVFGLSEGPPDETMVVAVNDTVAAVVPAAEGAYGLTAVDALLWPETLVDGANDVAVYVVDGEPEAPVLHPVTLTNR